MGRKYRKNQVILNQYQNLTPQQIEKFQQIKGYPLEEEIRLMIKRIQNQYDKIQQFIKDNPEVEPLYIMHKITK